MARQSWKGIGHPKPPHERHSDTYRGFRRNARRGNWIGIKPTGSNISGMIHRNRRHREDGRDYF